MIIKQATLDRRRVNWRSPPTLQSVPDGDALRAPVAHEPSDGVRSLAVAELNAQTVLTWLEGQDLPVRERVAQAVSDELERLREQVQETAQADGHREGLEQAAAESRTLIDVLGVVARECQAQFERECDAMRGSTVALVEAVLRKIAGPLLASERAVVGATLEVLERCTQGRDLKIIVSPLDLPVLEAARPQLTLALAQRPFELVSDETLSAGGCRVEGSQGTVDGAMALQCEELCALLREAKLQRAGVPP